MEARAFDSSSLPFLLILPDNYRQDASYPLIILLHGFGASMYDLAGLAPSIDSTGYMYVCPNAPYRLELGGGAVGFSWATGRPGVEEPAEPGPTPEEMLSSFIEDVTKVVQAEPGGVVLAGFSQGGGLTLRFGLPRADMFAGLAVLSGAFREPEGFRDQLPARRDIPIFMAYGLYDQMVSIERGQATAQLLESEGYKPIYREYPMAHQISDDVIADLTPWLHQVLPPLK
jgi:phospholipase/carboxylesterase